MLTAILFIVLGCYTFLIVYLIIVAVHFPFKPCTIPITTPPPLSIIIPCKNEEKNLPTLFSSLLRQHYAGTLEVIIVDDGSTDSTASIIHTAQKKQVLPIIYLKHEFNPGCNLTSKQQAIDAGISAAHFDHLVLTDADMVFAPTWLQSLIQSFTPETDLLFGHTSIYSTPSLFTYLQSFQLEFLFAIAALFQRVGIRGSCMGNNLLIRKNTYVTLGDQRAIGYSITEDRALLRHFSGNKRCIGLTLPFHPTAFTHAHTAFRPFINQMLRWARGGFQNGKNLLLYSILFSLQNCLLILGIFGFISRFGYILTCFNFLITWGLIIVTFKKFRAAVSPFAFPLYFIFLMIESAILLVLLIGKRTVTWKERTV